MFSDCRSFYEDDGLFAQVETPSRGNDVDRRRNLGNNDGDVILIEDSESNDQPSQLQPSGEILYGGREAKGFHLEAGNSYIYPTNYPVRQYQSNIVRTALFKNTLVTLPTGLGKTFIAAVVMYNFYRWYPFGKVVFMAPTRPLVAQQIKACHYIMNIPVSDTTEMTGVQNVELRKTLWKEKRVFFLTPQVLVNDLRSSICPAEFIKCVVVDEAHKAVKDYAYCQVMRLLQNTENCEFRVLALSATPGNDINAVQQVIQNLQITALEIRGEDSIDVASYTHSRAIDDIVVTPSPEMIRVKNDFLTIYEKYARKLVENKSIPSNLGTLSKFQILKSMEKFRANPPRGMHQSVVGSFICDFTICMTMAHAVELLQIYGLRAFYSYLSEENSEKCKAASSKLRNDQDLKKLLYNLKTVLYPISTENVPYVWSHPKLSNLVKSLTLHFKKFEEKKQQTKAIVFCQYRVVVTEIAELLQKSRPVIKAAVFIGQSGGKERGMAQSKQLEIMKDFREGRINCLVATCVAEEGLDIGEVDLIILMEAHKSPIRLVQRIGRTGRQRKGHCIILLAKGKEEQKFHEAMASRKSYVNNIANSKVIKTSLCQYSPSMLPPNVKPVQQLVHINVTKLEPTPEKKQPKKQVDIRHCLTVQETPFLSEEEYNTVIQELGTHQIEMKRWPGRQEIWHRMSDGKMKLDELLSRKFSNFSCSNEWNREVHRSFVTSNTQASLNLCNWLQLSKKPSHFVHFGDKELENLINQDFVNDTDIKDEKKTKKQKLDNGRDIRSCMAAAAEKTKKLPEKEILATTEPQADNDYESYLKVPTIFDKNLDMVGRLEKYLVKPKFRLEVPQFDLNINLDFIFTSNFIKDLDLNLLKKNPLNVSCELVGIEDLFFDDFSEEKPSEKLKSPSPGIINIDDLFSDTLSNEMANEVEKKTNEDDLVGLDELFKNEESFHVEKNQNDVVSIDDLLGANDEDLEKSTKSNERKQKTFNSQNRSKLLAEIENLEATFWDNSPKSPKLSPVKSRPSNSFPSKRPELSLSPKLKSSLPFFSTPKTKKSAQVTSTPKLVQKEEKTEIHDIDDIFHFKGKVPFKSDDFVAKLDNSSQNKLIETENLNVSIPLVSENKGKTFQKKNIISSQIVETKEPQKIDFGCFSDDDHFFELINSPHEESTMLGVTQLTSMIMKDKEVKIENHETTPQNETKNDPINKNKKVSTDEPVCVLTFEKTKVEDKDPFVFKSPENFKSFNKSPEKKLNFLTTKTPEKVPFIDLSSPSPSPIKRRKKKQKHNFIENEAEISGVASSDDSENSSLDDMDDSFIDDGTHADLTQAHYLKSIKSPAHGKYKIPAKRNFLDVFSQQVEQDSDYEHDSFCVDSEGEMADEVSELELAERKLAKKKKFGNLTASSTSCKSTSSKSTGSSNTPVQKLLKRRKNVLESDSDQEKTPKAKKCLKYFNVETPQSTEKSSSSKNSDLELEKVLQLSQKETRIDPEQLFQDQLQEALRLSQIESSRPTFGTLNSAFSSSQSSKPTTSTKSFKKQKKITEVFKNM